MDRVEYEARRVKLQAQLEDARTYRRQCFEAYLETKGPSERKRNRWKEAESRVTQLNAELQQLSRARLEFLKSSFYSNRNNNFEG